MKARHVARRTCERRWIRSCSTFGIRLWNAILVAIALALVHQSLAAATVFSDNFDSGASVLWAEEQGTWSDAGGVYQDLASGFSYSSVPFILTDFAIDVDINGVWDGGIFLRSEFNGGLFNGVTLITGGQGGGGTGVYWHEWTNGVNTPILNHSGTLFSSRSDIHVRIEVIGDTYSAFVNGSLTPVTTLTSSLFSSGKVALFNNAVSQSFDNVVISDLTPSVPEPTTLALFGLALASLGFTRRRLH